MSPTSKSIPSFLRVLTFVATVAPSLLGEMVTIVTDSTISSDSSSPPLLPTTAAPPDWPHNVTACYDELLHSHKLKYCRDLSRDTYNLTDTDPEHSCGPSTASPSSPAHHQDLINCTATCYAFYDQLECFDRMACDLCSTAESVDFDRAVHAQLDRARSVNGGPCHGVADYVANRTRCFSRPPQPLPPYPPGGHSDLSTFLVILICCVLAAALFAVCWMMLKLYLTGDLEECNMTTGQGREPPDSRAETNKRSTVGGRGGPGGKSSQKEFYGPVDFMDPKTKSRRRRMSLKSSWRKTSLLKTQQQQQQQNRLRTPKNGRGRLSTLKATLKTAPPSKSKQQPQILSLKKVSSEGGKFTRSEGKAGGKRWLTGKRKPKTRQTNSRAVKVQKSVAKSQTTTAISCKTSKSSNVVKRPVTAAKLQSGKKCRSR